MNKALTSLDVIMTSLELFIMIFVDPSQYFAKQLLFLIQIEIRKLFHMSYPQLITYFHIPGSHSIVFRN